MWEMRWEEGREEETQVSRVSKVHSLSRSDLGKLDCHYRIVMIYTYPSRGERARQSRRARTITHSVCEDPFASRCYKRLQRIINRLLLKTPTYSHMRVDLNGSALSPAAVDTRPLAASWPDLPSHPLRPPSPSLLADAPCSLASGPSVRESNSHPLIIRFAGGSTVSFATASSFGSFMLFFVGIARVGPCVRSVLFI